MNLYLIVFTADTYKKEQIYTIHKELFVALEQHFTLHLVNYVDADTIPSNAYKMAFIASGGVEEHVTQNFSIFPYPITLLTDGINNSLAASLEIAASIRSKDMRVNIIHGTPQEMTQKVLRHHQAFAAKRALKGKRIGVVGTPAPWLIASHVDYFLASQRWGVNYIDIPIEEIYKRFYSIADNEIGEQATLFSSNAKACQDTTPEELLRAMRLYKAIKLLREEMHLDAITLSCNSILSQLNTTGCVAAALLNDEGIPTSCEGDLQAIMTMLMAQVVTGKTSFMGNISFINSQSNEITLAHCSIPIQMTDEYILRNHSGLNKCISIQGIMHEGNITLFKCGGECLDKYYVSEGYLTDNTNLITACRTQLRIKLAKPINYFLTNPLGNHHILLQGNHAADLQEFMRQNRCKQYE